MSTTSDDLGHGESRVTTLETLYSEVCKAHDAITEFRGKLLALVPTLSAAAFTLIIGTRTHFDRRLLLPVGIFGVTVSLGLFCYELRGILLCHELRNRGAKLERVMQQPAADVRSEIRGHFLDRTEKHSLTAAYEVFKNYWPISVPTASFLVYGSVILGWLVVTGFGVAGFFSAASA